MHHWCITHLLGQFRDTTGSICNKSGLLVEGMGWGSLSNHFDSFQHLQLWHEKAVVLKMYLSCNVGPARMGIGLTSYHFLRLLGVQTSNPVSKETLYFSAFKQQSQSLSRNIALAFHMLRTGPGSLTFHLNRPWAHPWDSPRRPWSHFSSFYPLPSRAPLPSQSPLKPRPTKGVQGLQAKSTPKNLREQDVACCSFMLGRMSDGVQTQHIPQKASGLSNIAKRSENKHVWKKNTRDINFNCGCWHCATHFLCSAEQRESLCISVVDKTPKVMHQPNLNQHPPSLPFCQTTVLTFNSSNADLYNRSTSCSNRFKDYLSWENWVVLPPSSSGWPCVRSIT